MEAVRIVVQRRELVAKDEEGLLRVLALERLKELLLSDRKLDRLGSSAQRASRTTTYD